MVARSARETSPGNCTLTDLETGQQYRLLYNPQEFTVERAAHWPEHGANNQDGGDIEFAGGSPRTLAAVFFFDTTEHQQDVRVHTRPIEDLLLVNKLKLEKPEPRRLLFAWGTFSMPCVMERCSSKYFRFLSDGTPVRAELSVVLKEDTRKHNNQGRIGADEKPTQYEAKNGESLHVVATAVYGDPKDWIRIWHANPDLEDPFGLPTGKRLKLPV